LAELYGNIIGKLKNFEKQKPPFKDGFVDFITTLY
jgi:hypothetical protein